MGKVGRFVIGRKAGAYCHVVLDSGQRVIVRHDRGGFKGGHVTIDVPRFLGLGANRIFVCDLDSPAIKAAVRLLTRGEPPESRFATPLGAFVKYVRDCWCVEDVKAKCAALLSDE